MKRAVPIDFSYTRSASSGTSMPAEPAESVVNEKPCPIAVVGRRSSVDHHGRFAFGHYSLGHGMMSSCCLSIVRV